MADQADGGRITPGHLPRMTYVANADPAHPDYFIVTPMAMLITFVGYGHIGPMTIDGTMTIQDFDKKIISKYTVVEPVLQRANYAINHREAPPNDRICARPKGTWAHFMVSVPMSGHSHLNVTYTMSPGTPEGHEVYQGQHQEHAVKRWRRLCIDAGSPMSGHAEPTRWIREAHPHIIEELTPTSTADKQFTYKSTFTKFYLPEAPFPTSILQILGFPPQPIYRFGANRDATPFHEPRPPLPPGRPPRSKEEQEQVQRLEERQDGDQEQMVVTTSDLQSWYHPEPAEVVRLLADGTQGDIPASMAILFQTELALIRIGHIPTTPPSSAVWICDACDVVWPVWTKRCSGCLQERNDTQFKNIDRYSGPFLVPDEGIRRDPQGPSLFPRPRFQGFQPNIIRDDLVEKYEVNDTETSQVTAALREVRRTIDQALIPMRTARAVIILTKYCPSPCPRRSIPLPQSHSLETRTACIGISPCTTRCTHGYLDMGQDDNQWKPETSYFNKQIEDLEWYFPPWPKHPPLHINDTVLIEAV